MVTLRSWDMLKTLHYWILVCLISLPISVSGCISGLIFSQGKRNFKIWRYCRRKLLAAGEQLMDS